MKSCPQGKLYGLTFKIFYTNMIKKRVKTNNGEPLTLNGLMTELNNLFGSRKDDPKAMDIKSMLNALVNGEACFEEEDVCTQMNKHFEKNPTCDANTFVNAILGEGYDEKDEDDAMTACPDGLDPVVEEKNSPYDENYFEVYHTVKDAVNTTITVGLEDTHGKVIRAICFLSSPQMIKGIAETLGAMKKPTIAAFEGDVLTKAAILCGINRVKAHQQHGKLAAFAFDEQKGGMCRLSINCKDGYDFIIGENGVTRFIIFDEEVCPYVIPADIVQDDRKWGKRMSSEIPQLIEKTIEESKSNDKKLPFADAVKPALTKFDVPNLTEKKSAVCNLPETCEFNNIDERELVKQPLIADIMKDFADAKGSGKVGKDTFVEFMKPENKDAVAAAVATSIAERHNPSEDVIEKDEVTKAVESAIFKEEEDDFSDEDTNPNCFRCIAEYMAKEGVDSVHFWTDEDGLIHCDVQIKTVYKVELEDSDKK